MSDLSELHKTCTSEELPSRELRPYRCPPHVLILGWLVTKLRRLSFVLNAPRRWRLRRAMDRARLGAE